MSFEVSAEAYGKFMGRFSSPLGAAFADLTGVAAGQRALDVGAGAGALTAELVARLGAGQVCAVEPSDSFVAQLRGLFPAVQVRQATAEHLPFADDQFDLTLAQLVVHFMSDPVAGLAEMARVTRPGGLVGANVWDHAGGRGPLAVFWQAARQLDPKTRDESNLPGVEDGQLRQLFDAAGMTGATSTTLNVAVISRTFEDWWQPYTLGVGPAGDYVGGLDVDAREALRVRCQQLLPPAPIAVEVTAWTVLWTKSADS
jgi:SAM-dependent methyltransferase